MRKSPRFRLAVLALAWSVSACTASGTSLQMVTREPLLPGGSLRTVAPVVGDQGSGRAMDASLRTVAPLLSDEAVQGVVNDLRTVAPLTPLPTDPIGPSLPGALGESKLSVPTVSVATRSVDLATPEQIHQVGRQLAAATFKLPLLTRFGVQSIPDGSAIEHVTLVATEVAGTRVMVIEWVSQELRIWQVDGFKYVGLGDGLGRGLEESLSVTPVLEAWQRERARPDRKPIAFVSEGVLPMFEFAPEFKNGPSFPRFPWPQFVSPSVTSGESQGASPTATPVNRTVAGLAGHGFRVDWFARPDLAPLVVAQTLEPYPGDREEVVFDARTLEVLGVKLSASSMKPSEAVSPPHVGAANSGSEDGGVATGESVVSAGP